MSQPGTWCSAWYGILGVTVFSFAMGCAARADETQSSATLTQEPVKDPTRPLPPLSADWKALGSEQSRTRVWIHPKKKQVAVDGEVCLPKGYLEMFACIENSKEHESIVALKSKAYVIHTALLAVGAKPGAPASFQPEYTPASGTTIEVFVEWMDKDQSKRVKAQQWIRDLKTQKAMEHDWVFAGSSLWKDPETGKSYYRAEGGDLICVSNFPTAMMDLPIQSSQANDELAFEAFSEHIPPRGTPVRLYLVPQFEGPSAGRKDVGHDPPK